MISLHQNFVSNLERVNSKIAVIRLLIAFLSFFTVSFSISLDNFELKGIMGAGLLQCQHGGTVVDHLRVESE